MVRGADLEEADAEIEQEDFLVLSGEALLIVEGQERHLRRWDFVHCPPETRHVPVGARDGPCVILAASSRQATGPWGFYTVDETDRPHGAARTSRRRTESAHMRTSSLSADAPPRRGVLPD